MLVQISPVSQMKKLILFHLNVFFDIRIIQCHILGNAFYLKNYAVLAILIFQDNDTRLRLIWWMDNHV